MSDVLYPADVVITVDDIRNCGWKEALATKSEVGYVPMWRALSKAAADAISGNHLKQGRALWLLADACSLRLDPQSKNEPLKPYFISSKGRSIAPSDFSKEEMDLLASAIDAIDDPWLKARIADLVWLAGNPRKIEVAFIAIDSYRSIDLTADTWIQGGHQCWERAFALADNIGKPGKVRLGEMLERVIARLREATADDGLMPVYLAGFVEPYVSKQASIEIATILESLGKAIANQSDFPRSRRYFETASNWFSRVEDRTRAATLKFEVARSWEEEAGAMSHGGGTNYAAAASLYENAIHAYRRIPRPGRAAYEVDERIEKLRIRLNEVSRNVVDRMVPWVSPTIGLGKYANEARRKVTGKAPRDALAEFARLGGVDVDGLRKEAIAGLREHRLTALFPITMYSDDGRVIARVPGAGLGSDGERQTAKRVHYEMVHHYTLQVGIMTVGEIVPALEQIRIEHRFRELDFVELAYESPIVPKSRYRVFGRGLFAGYDGDFAVALHLLVPQLEHMVRVHLKEVGARTTTLSDDGIETENGLRSLLNGPEAAAVFGENIAFELRSLLCDRVGPNLRNRLAHGLLEQAELDGIYAAYVWWLSLKLVFLTWWNRAREEQEEIAN